MSRFATVVLTVALVSDDVKDALAMVDGAHALRPL
jgi:hypothetical protein